MSPFAGFNLIKFRPYISDRRQQRRWRANTGLMRCAIWRYLDRAFCYSDASWLYYRTCKETTTRS